MFEERITHQFDLDELEEEREILARMNIRKCRIDESVLYDNRDDWSSEPVTGRVTIPAPPTNNDSRLDSIIERYTATPRKIVRDFDTFEVI